MLSPSIVLYKTLICLILYRIVFILNSLLRNYRLNVSLYVTKEVIELLTQLKTIQVLIKSKHKFIHTKPVQQLSSSNPWILQCWREKLHSMLSGSPNCLNITV